MYKDGKIYDKDGIPFTDEETEDYTNDLWDGGVPMSESYLKNYLWPKWGERLGIAKPE